MHRFGQFLFDRQWAALKKFAAERRVRIVGDAPIFVALDSADVWANPDEFLLDPDRRPTVVAGVPPDYFAADGQHWGNPIYDWERMEQTGYAWWVARTLRALEQVDAIRLDHFRGFGQAWHIPAGEKTARHGKWVDGPGAKLFEAMRKALWEGEAPAEPLTPGSAGASPSQSIRPSHRIARYLGRRGDLPRGVLRADRRRDTLRHD